MRVCPLLFEASFALALSGCVLSSGIPDWTAADTQGSGLQELTDTLTISTQDDRLVDATINGHPVRLRVELGHTGIVLNPDIANRIGLESSIGGKALVGPISVKAYSASVDVAHGHAVSRQRVAWYEKPVTEEADGVVNIANLPYRSVTLLQGIPRPDETETTLQTIVRNDSVIFPFSVDGRTIDLRFNSSGEKTIVTTAAAAHLFATNGGKWSGQRSDYAIAFGIPRAVRPMTLARPLPIGTSNPLVLDQFLVRLRDYQGKSELPADPEAEDAAILVKGKQSAGSEYFITMGRDMLDRCSSVTYARDTQLLTLRCGPSARGS